MQVDVSDVIQLVVLAFAAVLHGITGMGFPMIGTTTLAAFMPLSQAVVLVALPSLLMSFFILFGHQKQSFSKELVFYRHHYWRLFISSILGGLVGIWVLLFLPVAVLYLLMAAITLFYVINTFLVDRNKITPIYIPSGHKSMVVFGFLSGVVGTSTNAMSPILMMYLFAKTNDRNEIIKASNVCYLFGKIIQLVLLRQQLAEVVSGNIMRLVILTVIPLLFLYVGMKLRQYLNAMLFKYLILLVLFLLGIKIGYTGLVKLSL